MTGAPPKLILESEAMEVVLLPEPLAWPGLGVSASLEVAASAAAICVAVANPAALDAVAIEPQTHGPDPIRRLERGEPDAPVLLDAGDTLGLTLTMTVARAPNAQ